MANKKRETSLNPAEARLRKRPGSLEAVGPLSAQYKAQDEGGLGALKSVENQMQQGEAAERRARLAQTKQQG